MESCPAKNYDLSPFENCWINLNNIGMIINPEEEVLLNNLIEHLKVI